MKKYFCDACKKEIEEDCSETKNNGFKIAFYYLFDASYIHLSIHAHRFCIPKALENYELLRKNLIKEKEMYPDG